VRRLPLLTTSAAKTYRACPRLFWLRYEEGYRPTTDDPNLRFGKLGHSGLEAWWEARRLYPSSPELWHQAAIAALRAHEYRDPFAQEKAHALIDGYHYRWEDEPLTVLAVELEFNVDLSNPATSGVSKTWGFGGKIDAIAEIGGERWLVEHKTSAEDFSVGSDYRIRLRLDAQISNYMIGARALGFDPKGVLYDVIGKPAQRPLLATPPESRKYKKKTGELYENQRDQDETSDEYGVRVREKIAESPEDFYARWPVVRTDEESREAAFDLWQSGVQIRESRAAGAWPRNSDSCKRYGRPCPFLAVCSGHASLEDPTRFRKSEKKNEELGEGERAA
jgi:hypothetical protein